MYRMYTRHSQAAAAERVNVLMDGWMDGWMGGWRKRRRRKQHRKRNKKKNKKEAVFKTKKDNTNTWTTTTQGRLCGRGMEEVVDIS